MTAAVLPSASAKTRMPPVRIDATYVDEARTHHVRATVVDDPAHGPTFVVDESAGPKPAPRDTLTTRTRIRDGWEARFHQADLEGRLGQMGAYWRHDRARDRGWVKLREHPGVPRVDLRAVTLPEAEGEAAFHQFHHPAEARDQLLVAVPRRVDRTTRYLLADLSFDFPRAEAGDLRILHERLAPGPLRSLLTREHMELSRRGFEKLADARAFGLLYGPEWRDLMKSALQEALARIHEGRTGPGVLPLPRDSDDHAITDYQRILLDPRLHVVHRRFLPPEDEARLLDSTDVVIRRWIAQKRREVDHASQHLLSLLEASLLARLGLRQGTHVDPQVARQLRRLAFYL